MRTNLLPFKKPWARCVGSERVSTMLRAEYWERFDEVQAVMGYQFIRCHGLLGDELGLLRIDSWEGKRQVFYNYSYIDQIFDLILEHRVRPFVEFGFMPGALASGPETVFWWKGNITPPADYGEWADLLDSLVSHWIERYGIEEVRQWPMEVWNEPNLEQFWLGASKENYFSLYKTSVLAIKAVDEGIKVGGPAICGGSDHWIEDFLAFVRANQLPLDFFSRHLYTAKSPSFRSPEFYYQSLADPRSPIDELRSVRERIDQAGFPNLEIHITEFNTSYNPLCPVHDTPLNAAYLARLLSESGDLVSTLSYWTFSDLFEECDVPRSLFHGGFGLLARFGIPKPSYYLFAFFRQMGEGILLRNEACLATQRADGTVTVIAWNPVLKTGQSMLRVLSIDVPWQEGPALATRSRVHEKAGNPWGLWRAMGRPRYPDASTVNFLKTAAKPEQEVAVLKPSNSTLRLSFTLQKNEVSYIELTPFVDESPSYKGLDDSLIDGYENLTDRKGELS